jgi:bacteriorhodopsin
VKWTLVNVIHHKKEPVELIFRPIYWARYVDWAIGSSLTLIELTVLAGLPGAEILLVVFLDVAMIVMVGPSKNRLTIGSP